MFLASFYVNNSLLQAVVLIAGGIGITPCLSYWKHYLMNDHHRPKKVILIWFEKHLKEFQGIYDDQFAGRAKGEEIVLSPIGSERIAILEKTTFDYHFYLTREKNSSNSLSESNHSDQDRISENRRSIFSVSSWNSGRLDLKIFFSSLRSFVREKNRANSRIGVVVCGPFPLIQDVSDACRNCCDDVAIDLHEEFFSL